MELNKKLHDSLLQANSAIRASVISEEIEKTNKIMEEVQKQNAETIDKLVAGAQANIDQSTLLGKQLKMLEEQNSLLSDNYKKLKEMYDAQKVSYNEAREDVKRSRRYNVWMMIISVIAMFAAIVSPIVSIMLQGE